MVLHVLSFVTRRFNNAGEILIKGEVAGVLLKKILAGS